MTNNAMTTKKTKKRKTTMYKTLHDSLNNPTKNDSELRYSGREGVVPVLNDMRRIILFLL
jgi:hypothetical protein